MSACVYLLNLDKAKVVIPGISVLSSLYPEDRVRAIDCDFVVASIGLADPVIGFQIAEFVYRYGKPVCIISSAPSSQFASAHPEFSQIANNNPKQVMMRFVFDRHHLRDLIIKLTDPKHEMYFIPAQRFPCTEDLRMNSLILNPDGGIHGHVPKGGFSDTLASGSSIQQGYEGHFRPGQQQ